MEKTILKTVMISLDVEDFQKLIIDAVNVCLKYSDKAKTDAPKTDRFLTVSQAADFLNLAVPTIYGLCYRSQIPYMKRNKRLYFSETELRNWIKGGRRQTIQEIKADASTSLHQDR